MTKIHSTAVISPSAEIADKVEIGTYCYIGDHVRKCCYSYNQSVFICFK
ncbi:MAG: hypothetical protein LBP75_09960 [Planctomycetota bacterium]|jgi:acyl-[acyl carrier protein]--UDP-N-acetylglucosamine O-acyltransferase|nr:hypothetical protein [Planctomycetota bacterium]